MNRILIDSAELSDIVTLSGPRAQHIHAVLKSAPGDTIKIGVIDSACGKAEVLATTPENAQLKIFALDEVSIEPWCDVLLAMPRPRAMKRLWPQLATLGVGNIHLLDAAKVEKTYFASHVIDPETFTPLLIDGLMQSGATILPRVHIHPRIKTFFEKILPTLLTPNTLPLLAHPGPATPLKNVQNIPLGMCLAIEETCFSNKNIPLGMCLSVEETCKINCASRRDASIGTERRIPTGCETEGCAFLPRDTSLTGCHLKPKDTGSKHFRPLLAIGPDGGWTPDEQEKFFTAGFAPFSLGERALRTDTACVALLATLNYLLSIDSHRQPSKAIESHRIFQTP